MVCALLCKHGELGNAYTILVVKHERKRVLGRLMSRWEANISNITVDIRETEYEGVG
jgi:hypothetical protein